MCISLTVQDSAARYSPLDSQHEDWIIARAMQIIEGRFYRHGESLNQPSVIKNFLRAKLNSERRESFAVVFLDGHHRLLAYEVLFQGTLGQASVYPRVVVEKALGCQAAAVILAHNHPSGMTEPSQADRMLTTALKSALALLDIRVLDHVIVGEGEPCSMAECGLL
ncbi:MAG: DNA repair protein RadC [Desulfobulbus sp.]|nr:DNA repair protein RadC [Desulfobulbus sp.]